MNATGGVKTCSLCGGAFYPMRSKKDPAWVVYVCLRCDGGMQRQ